MKIIIKKIVTLLAFFSLGATVLQLDAHKKVLGLGQPRENIPIIGALDAVEEAGYTALDACSELKDYVVESVKLFWDHKGKIIGISIGSGLIYSLSLNRFVPILKFTAKVTVVPMAILFGLPIAKVLAKVTNEWMIKPLTRHFANKSVKVSSSVVSTSNLNETDKLKDILDDLQKKEAEILALNAANDAILKEQEAAQKKAEVLPVAPVQSVVSSHRAKKLQGKKALKHRGARRV